MFGTCIWRWTERRTASLQLLFGVLGLVGSRLLGDLPCPLRSSLMKPAASFISPCCHRSLLWRIATLSCGSPQRHEIENGSKVRSGQLLEACSVLKEGKCPSINSRAHRANPHACAHHRIDPRSAGHQMSRATLTAFDARQEKAGQAPEIARPALPVIGNIFCYLKRTPTPAITRWRAELP